MLPQRAKQGGQQQIHIPQLAVGAHQARGHTRRFSRGIVAHKACTLCNFAMMGKYRMRRGMSWALPICTYIRDIQAVAPPCTSA